MLTYPIVFGARVRIRNWPSRFGAVVSVWNKTAMVKWDDLAKPERCYLIRSSLRPLQTLPSARTPQLSTNGRSACRRHLS